MTPRLLFSALMSIGLSLVPGGAAQGQGVERASASAAAAAPRLPARVFSAELAARPDTPQAKDLAATLLKAIASRGSAKSLQRTLSGIKGTRLFSKARLYGSIG